ncbi:MAG: sulfotransferase domain-containing protein, partial [Cyanobacteria bacterium J06576_12]
IICAVRTPHERILSHIKQLVRKGKLPKLKAKLVEREELEEMFRLFPQLARYTFYADGIETYKRLFGPERVLVVNQADCKHKPSQVLRTLYQFLDVEPSFEPTIANQKISVGIIPKYQGMERFRIKFYQYLHRAAPAVITVVKKFGLSELYRKLNSDSGTTVNLSDEAKAFIEQKFRLDWQRTRNHLSALVDNS